MPKKYFAQALSQNHGNIGVADIAVIHQQKHAGQLFYASLFHYFYCFPSGSSHNVYTWLKLVHTHAAECKYII